MFPFALDLLALLPAGDAPARVERRVPMMGTLLELVVEAPDRPAALAASEAAVQALEATEERLSTWRPDSELARLNRAPVGEAVAVSAELQAELAGAAECRRRTGGAFDPGIGALLAAWDVRGEGRVPAPAELRSARAAGGLEGLELGPGGTAVRRRPGLVIDEGGFGKGAGLDRAMEALAASPHPVCAFLDLGGQIAVSGGDSWPVAVAHPRRRERPVLRLDLTGGSVATSGTSQRGAHLLDPRTGRPARDFGSLTVFAPTGLEADCLATGLYVLGPEAALAWGEAAAGVEVLVLEVAGEGLRARATSGLAGRLTPLVPEVSLELPEPPAHPVEEPGALERITGSLLGGPEGGERRERRAACELASRAAHRSLTTRRGAWQCSAAELWRDCTCSSQE